MLLEAVALEGPVVANLVAVTAEWMTHEREIQLPLRLRLPDVRHFMDEETLAAQRLAGEIIGPHTPLRVEIDVPHRGHRRVARMEGPPFSLEKADMGIVNCVPEHGTSDGEFAGSESA